MTIYSIKHVVCNPFFLNYVLLFSVKTEYNLDKDNLSLLIANGDDDELVCLGSFKAQ